MRHVTKAIVFAVAWTNCAAWAQTVPADLVDVSIEDLFAANVVTEEERGKYQEAVVFGVSVRAS